MLQVPQLALSVVVSTHLPLQSVSPLWQLRLQVPALHTSPELQAVAQAPQLALSVIVSTHLPEEIRAR